MSEKDPYSDVVRERDEARKSLRAALAHRDRIAVERDEAISFLRAARGRIAELEEERDELREERNVAQAVADANLRTAQLSIPRPATDLADALYFLRAAQRVILDATQQNTP